MRKQILSIIIGLTTWAAAGGVFATSAQELMSKALGQLPDDREAQVLTVEFSPGESSLPHRHHAHTFVYVLEGRLEFQINGGELVTLGPGDTFYESPEDIHTVARNLSDEQGAKILVFFIKEAGAPATLPL